MKKLLVLCLLFCLAVLPALADDVALLPDGRTLTLKTTLLGTQYRGADAQHEHLWQLEILDQNALFQTLAFSTEADEAWIKVQDLNFDGWPDLDILYLLGASNSQHIYFFYDGESGRYEPWTYSYSWLSNVEVNAEKQVLVNYIHDSAATGVTEIYRWEGKKLHLVRRAEVQWAEENPDMLLFTLREPGQEPNQLEESFYAALDVTTAPEGEELKLSQELNRLLWEGL